MKIVALSNGIHIFENEGERTITNIVKKDVTEECIDALVAYMRIIRVDDTVIRQDGRNYRLKLIEEDE